MSLFDLRLIPPLTVKIQSGATQFGTGFFVTPNHVLTCAHVIEKTNPDSLTLWWKNSETLQVKSVAAIFSDPYDVALLELQEENKALSLLVELHPDIKPNDDLYAFGYTDDYLRGGPVTFVCEGLTGDLPPLVKFKAGRARPGLSGSPLVNLRTGLVCGMVKYTADRNFDIGGGAVWAASILEILPFLNHTENSKRIPEMTDVRVEESFFTNKSLLYLDKVDTVEKHGAMWRWDQRMFRHRHPAAYEDFDLVGLELGRSWWQKYPEQDWVLRDWQHEQIGQYCLIPIKKDIFEELAAGKKIETEVTTEGIVPTDDVKRHKHWYCANFMRAKVKPGVNSGVGVYASNLMIAHALNRALSSEQFATKFGEEIVVIAFVEAKSIRGVVEANRFTKMFPHTNDASLEKLYMALWNKDMLTYKLTETTEKLKELEPIVEQYKGKAAFQQPPNF